MTQGDLFDNIPASHAGDPETSREAERLVTKLGTRARHAAQVLALVKEYPGSTAGELWGRSGLGEYQIRRRLTDLLHAGLVRRGEARACVRKGTKMVTWYAEEERSDR